MIADNYRKANEILRRLLEAETLESSGNSGEIPRLEFSNFADKWRETYPAVVRSWQQNWSKVIPMFSFVPEIRKAIYRGERHRIAEYDVEKSYQKPDDVPIGRSGVQDFVSRLEKYQQTVDNADCKTER